MARSPCPGPAFVSLCWSDLYLTVVLALRRPNENRLPSQGVEFSMAPMEWHCHYTSQVWALHILFGLTWSTDAHACDLRWGSEIFLAKSAQAKHEHLQANLKSKSNPQWRPETWACHNASHFCFLQSSAYWKDANGPAFLRCLSFILVLRIQEWQNN